MKKSEIVFSLRVLTQVGFLGLLLSGCSVGGNDPNTPPEDPSITVEAQIVLGPVSGATVTVANLAGTQVTTGLTTTFKLEEDTTAVDGVVRLKNRDAGRKVGIVSFARTSLATPTADALLLISATGGRDTDADDDGLLASTEGAQGTTLRGKAEALVNAENLRGGKVTVNLLTTLAAAARTAGADAPTVRARASRFAKFMLADSDKGGDLDRSGTVDLHDLTLVDPSRHEFSTKPPTRPDDAALRSIKYVALIRPFSTRLLVGGDANTAAGMTVEMFGDANRDGLANVFEDPAKNDSDGDGSMDDVDTDLDGDGLANTDELNQGLNPWNRDSDNDGISDQAELNIYMSDPLTKDSDGDGLNDGDEINNHRSDPQKKDSDDDGIDDGLEVNGFTLFDKVTVVRTNPASADSDGDLLHDGLEKAVQDNFAKYAKTTVANAFLMQQLNPAGTTPPDLGKLDYSATTFTAAVLEEDPDRDGKPTIEELFHATNPNSATSTFAYIFEVSPTDTTRKPKFQGMEAEQFVYVPGGWDVDDDGTVDLGFFVSKYEARYSATPLANSPTLASLLGQALVYNPTSKTFKDRLCDNSAGGSGGDAGTMDTTGECRGNRYASGTTAIAVGTKLSTATFVPSATPATNLTWAESRAVLTQSPVDASAARGGPYPIDLPTETQWLQLTRLAINSADNWTGGSIGMGQVYGGHSDNSPSTVLAVSEPGNRYADTGNNGEQGIEQRRTLTLANGVMARDFDLPLGYKVEVWDLAGNAAEVTRGLMACIPGTSAAKTRTGGDRFIDGLTAAVDYLGNTVSGTRASTLADMPTWWKPAAPNGMVFSFLAQAGYYLDGFAGSDTDKDGRSNGCFTDADYGYGPNGYVDGFAATLRGGDFRSGELAGVGTADFQNGLGRRQPATGFRAAAPL